MRLQPTAVLRPWLRKLACSMLATLGIYQDAIMQKSVDGAEYSIPQSSASKG